jgi:hypothetical protein
MIIGEFAGPPFIRDLRKDKGDKQKLLRVMKDVFDLRIQNILRISHGRIDKEIYESIKTLEVYGILSLGRNLLYLA